MPSPRQRYRADATLDSIGDAVLSTDLDGHVTYLNRAAEAMTGWSRAAAMGQPLDQVFHVIDRETRSVTRDPGGLAVQLDRTVGLAPDCLLISRDGREIAIEDSAAPIHDRAGRVTGAVIVFRDVGAALEVSRQMAHLAQHDTLTGLPNRLLLSDRLTEAIARAQRHNKPLGVLFLDVDGFKRLNDAFGHAAGDRRLRAIGARLAGALRQSDTVSRYGGDEFVVLLPELEHDEDASVVAEKLQRAVTHLGGDDGGAPTMSIGISLYPAHGVEAGALIARADAAMFEAKRAGPGGFRVFDAASEPAPEGDREPTGGTVPFCTASP